MSQLALLDLELDRGQLTEATEAMWGEPSPGVQWSFSAHSALRRCQLQYFFGYKLANAKSLDPERREAWILGQLQDLARWRGRLVDHGMEHILVPSLKAGRIPTLDELVQPTLAVARRQWDFSAGGHYRQPGLRKGPCQDDFCALYEHEYGMIVGETDRARVESEVVDAFRNLLQLSDLLDHLRQQRTFQAQRTLWILFERARVRAIPDLLCWGGR